MINFATVGTSWITEEFIAAGKTNCDFNLRAVYSRSEEKAAAFAKKHDAETYYCDLSKMLADDKTDAVYIASPNSLHCHQAIAAMNAGKHVFCEKPAASNLSELDRMIECADKNGVFFMEAFKSILMPGFVACRENLYKAGIIRSVYINFSKYSSRYDAHKRGENVNTFKAEFSNGAVMDLGVYCLWPVVALFGMPKEIKALGVKVPGGVDGAGTAILLYDTFTVILNYSKVGNSFLPSEIQGEDATICVDKFNIPEKVTVRYRNGTVEEIPVSQRTDSMCYEADEFISCVKSGKKESSVNSRAMSRNVMILLDEIRRQTGVVYPADNL
ncbi:MAG: Gfo/Idh/MocA family oxidoreductase [Clostridia bacterium]|nr:Gfo/Idh/MocA family oxidoreductase [Clostridia bacterium]